MRLSRRDIFIRGFLLAIASGAIVWAVWVLSYERRVGPLREISSRMLNGEQYGPDQIARLMAFLDRTETSRSCAEGGLDEAAVIRLYALGLAVASKAKDLNGSIENARHAVRSALACSPSSGLLWFELFWLDLLQDNPTSQQALSYLRMSYKLAPNEGWISSIRSRRVLEIYQSLPPDLQASARSEFLLMARDNPHRAVDSFERQHEAIRALLLPLLADLPIERRKEFARRLDSPNVEIPGVVLDDLSKAKQAPPQPSFSTPSQ